MKFDVVAGNPPYQESGTTNNKAEAIYPFFYDAAEQVADKYILISPARFLFNAGLTSKAWNEKMLSDEHIKVERYYQDSSDIFSNTNINGGVAIVYRDSHKIFQPIEIFIPNEMLRKIVAKVNTNRNNSMMTIMFGGRSDLKFNNAFLDDYPETPEIILQSLQAKHPTITTLAPNEIYEIKSSSFERTPYAFINEEPQNPKDYYRLLGIERGKRIWKWVAKKYLNPRYPDHNNIEGYKVMIAKADGAAGTIGHPIPARVIGRAEIARPGDSAFPSFISIGNFSTECEAINAERYIRTKFARLLVGTLKVTQDITPSKWRYVPLQDFTSSSDVDWSKSIHEIDLQLYKKYGLSKEEIDFIETHVKEMV